MFGANAGSKDYINGKNYLGGGREGAGGLDTGDEGRWSELEDGESDGAGGWPGLGERERGGG